MSDKLSSSRQANGGLNASSQKGMNLVPLVALGAPRTRPGLTVSLLEAGFPDVCIWHTNVCTGYVGLCVCVCGGGIFSSEIIQRFL